MTRAYPLHPIVGVGAVIVREGREVVLIRRRNEPQAGAWSLPGGALELGEIVEAGVTREALEETGLVVAVGPLLEVVTRVFRDDAGRVKYHYVLLDYLCSTQSDGLRASDDAAEAVWAPAGDLDRFGLQADTLAVVRRGLARAGA